MNIIIFKCIPKELSSLNDIHIHNIAHRKTLSLSTRLTNFKTEKKNRVSN
jgi:hypothetical protein